MVTRIPPLPTRLAAVAEAIAPGRRVADIGTDHGKLPLWLAGNGLVDHCLATEKSETLLSQVRRAPTGAAWGALLAYRAGDGLRALRPADRIDTVVLAGLGGRTIVRLLDAAAGPVRGLSRITLQPRSEPALARLWLSRNGWRPVWERLAEDSGRFYPTLAAEPGDDAELYRHAVLSREDLLAAGPLLVRSLAPEVRRFWALEQGRLAALLGRDVPSPASARLRAGLARAQRILEAISTRAE